jgi:acetyl-CoA carboxylase biotin carboxyl carrier protein
MDVNSEMTGTVWKVLATVGDVVVGGQTLMILESMKMEIPVNAPIDGTLTSLNVGEGDAIADGQLLAQVE